MNPNSEASSERRSLVLLNEMGGVEISWDSSEDEKMRTIIQKKMDEGIKFFMIEISGTKAKSVRLKNLDDLTKHRINVKDADIEKLFTEGSVEFSKRDVSNAHIASVGLAKTAQQAASGHSVGVRQYQGG